MRRGAGQRDGRDQHLAPAHQQLHADEGVDVAAEEEEEEEEEEDRIDGGEDVEEEENGRPLW